MSSLSSRASLTSNRPPRERKIATRVKCESMRRRYRRVVKDETRRFYVASIERTVARLVGTLDDAVDLGDLAKRAGLSPLHFHRIFRGMIGETPVGLHRRLRLERAALHLANTSAEVTRIAFEAGYETHESFTRAFRDAYARSPSEFRVEAQRATATCGRAPMTELAAAAGVHYSRAMAASSASADHSSTLTVSLRKDSPMEVQLTTLPEQRVAAVSHRGPYTTISEAFARLGQLVGPTGLLARPGAAMVAIYHDDPEATPAAELRSDAGVVVPVDAVLPAGVSELRIPAGLVACTTHVGPYNLLGDAWARFMGGWLPQSGHRLGPGMSYERYHNTPMTAKPEELRTDLVLSLASPEP
jgi:AraC family transcriptional regulator